MPDNLAQIEGIDFKLDLIPILIRLLDLATNAFESRGNHAQRATQTSVKVMFFQSAPLWME
jgi:hypothetical protein